MIKTRSLSRATLVASLLVAATGSALAQSADFSTWARAGDVATTANGALLSTAATDSGEAPVYGGNAWLYTDLEQAMGTRFGGDTYEGSGVFTSFAATAGTTVSVSWALTTGAFDAGFADRAYAVVDGNAVAISEVSAYLSNGIFSHTFTTTGTHTLGFALLDVNDVTGVSDFSVTALTVTAVPEPGTSAMLLAGLGLAGLLARRRA